MPSKLSSPKTKTWRRWASWLLSYGLAAACLYWVFRGVPFGEVYRTLARVKWWWVGLAAALDVLVYVCAAWEWQLLLRPVGRLSLRQTTQAVFVGRFANDVLPVHAGYVFRVLLVSRWAKASVAAVLPSLIVERFFDTFWLVLCIGTTVLFLPMPTKVIRTGEILGGLILFGGALASWLIYRYRHGPPRALSERWNRWRWMGKLQQFFDRLIDGLRKIAKSFLLPAALGLSVVKLGIQALTFLILLWSYGFDFSLWVGMAVFLVAYVGISLPSTPASMGVFQVFCVTGLTLFGVAKPQASSFALVAFLVLTAPLSIGGFFAFAHSGWTWRQLRREVRHWKETS